jgi:hypothetical protein
VKTEPKNKPGGLANRSNRRYDIFISYASEDAKFVRKIGDTLERRGVSCWLASGALKPGDDWRSVIQDAIEGSKMCLLLISEKAMNPSPWVSKEWALVLENFWKRDDLIVITVLLDDVETPAFLDRWQAFRCENQPSDVDRICKQVTQQLEGETNPGKNWLAARNELEVRKRFREIFQAVEKSATAARAECDGDDNE